MQLEVEYKNKKQELSDYNDFLMKNQTALKKYRRFKRIVMLPIGIIFSIFILVAKYPLMRVHQEVTPNDIVYILAPTLVGILWCVFMGILSYLIRKENFEDKLKDESINFEEDIVLNLSEEGIKYTREKQETLFCWNFIKKVEEEKETLYIVMKDNSGVVVPLSVFDEDLTKEEFVDYINNEVAESEED